MAKEYYTIKEFAAIKGISQQAVYKKLATTLQPYVVLVDGRKVLKPEALQPHSTPTAQPFSTTNTTREVENDKLDIVKLLKDQIEQKDKLIERLQESADEKDKYIREQGARLTDLIEQANMLQQNNQMLLKMLTGTTEEKDVVIIPEEENNKETTPEIKEENKKSFFSKIFG